jgi:carbohydrate-binding DOMON domain-containing protein
VPPEEVIVEKPVEVPVEVIPTWTYGVVGVAVIAVIAAIVVALRRR